MTAETAVTPDEPKSGIYFENTGPSRMEGNSVDHPVTRDFDESTARAEQVMEQVDEAAEILARPVGEVTIRGVVCDIKRIRTRESFILIRILTLGGKNADMLASIFQTGKTPEQMAQELAATFLLLLPNAEADVMHLIRHMVDRRDGTTDEDWVKVQHELGNPDLETTLEVGQQIVLQEFPELARLGKAMQSWWKVMGPTLKRSSPAGPS